MTSTATATHLYGGIRWSLICNGPADGVALDILSAAPIVGAACIPVLRRIDIQLNPVFQRLGFHMPLRAADNVPLRPSFVRTGVRTKETALLPRS